MSENELVERRVDHAVADPIPARGGISFDNAGQVMEFAKLMAGSGSAVPRHLRGSPGACLGILDDAIRFGINPYALARKSYFVNDMLAYEAAVFMGIINSRAPLIERPDIRWEGTGPDRVCIVSGTFLKGHAVREYRSPRFEDIHPKNSTQWKNDPDQQQSYFSLRAWARRWCPEVILGMQDIDELREIAMTDVTPRTAAPKTLAEFAAREPEQIVDRTEEDVVEMDRGVDEAQAVEVASPAPAAGNAPQATQAGSGPLQTVIADAMRLAISSQYTPEKRLAQIEKASDKWFEQVPADRHKLIFTVIDYASKVALGELDEDKARKYLGALAGGDG